jgi:hypothetical protein
MPRSTMLIAAFVVLVGSFLGTLHFLDRGVVSTSRPNSHERLLTERRYDYRNGVSAKQWLGSGWAWPEPFGIWTDGDRSEIQILLDRRTQRAEVLMDTIAFVDQLRPQQEISVFVWQKKVATWKYDQAQAKAVRSIDLVAVDISMGTVIINLEVKDPKSPKSLGLSESDTRKIALGLVELTVREYQ